MPLWMSEGRVFKKGSRVHCGFKSNIGCNEIKLSKENQCTSFEDYEKY